jgi:glutathione S-transferase
MPANSRRRCLLQAPEKPRIIGRSSSHFTRVARIFASELGVEYSFEVVRDLLSSVSQDYGGNPALKLPVLETSSGSWYGTLNICRTLARHSKHDRVIIWPEDLREPLPANAQEFTVQAMATEVSLIMGKVAGEAPQPAYQAKLQTSLANTLSWLDANLHDALSALPAERDLSFLEVTLFCLVTHLDFRNVAPTTPYSALTGFCERFATRASAQETRYRFDA